MHAALVLMVHLAMADVPHHGPPSAAVPVAAGAAIGAPAAARADISAAPEAWFNGDNWAINAHRVPPSWEREPAVTTLADWLQGSLFGLTLLLMVVASLGTLILFLRPRRVTWWTGAHMSRAEAREILGRL